jgi:hypothetical protein
MLDTSVHTLNNLFAQLGLPNSDKDIDDFVAKHQPLPQATRLSDARFWTPSQASFLRESIVCDADWAEVVDQLNALLRD